MSAENQATGLTIANMSTEAFQAMMRSTMQELVEPVHHEIDDLKEQLKDTKRQVDKLQETVFTLQLDVIEGRKLIAPNPDPISIHGDPIQMIREVMESDIEMESIQTPADDLELLHQNYPLTTSSLYTGTNPASRPQRSQPTNTDQIPPQRSQDVRNYPPPNRNQPSTSTVQQVDQQPTRDVRDQQQPIYSFDQPQPDSSNGQSSYAEFELPLQFARGTTDDAMKEAYVEYSRNTVHTKAAKNNNFTKQVTGTRYNGTTFIPSDRRVTNGFTDSLTMLGNQQQQHYNNLRVSTIMEYPTPLSKLKTKKVLETSRDIVHHKAMYQVDLSPGLWVTEPIRELLCVLMQRRVKAVLLKVVPSNLRFTEADFHNYTYVSAYEFFRYPTSTLISLMQEAVRPKGIMQFANELLSLLRFPPNTFDPKNPTPEDYETLYIALLMYRTRFSQAYSFLSEDNEHCVPPLYAKDYGLINIFLSAITPYKVAKALHTTVSRGVAAPDQKFNDIWHYMRVFYATVEKNAQDVKNAHQVFASTCLLFDVDDRNILTRDDEPVQLRRFSIPKSSAPDRDRRASHKLQHMADDEEYNTALNALPSPPLVHFLEDDEIEHSDDEDEDSSHGILRDVASSPNSDAEELPELPFVDDEEDDGQQLSALETFQHKSKLFANRYDNKGKKKSAFKNQQPEYSQQRKFDARPSSDKRLEANNPPPQHTVACPSLVHDGYCTYRKGCGFGHSEDLVQAARNKLQRKQHKFIDPRSQN